MLNVASTASPSPGARIQMGKNRAELDPRANFSTAGEFFFSVKQAGIPGGHLRDERLDMLATTPTTEGNEAIGADGGFLVPPQFARDIFTYSALDDALLSLCDVVPTDGNSMMFPIDENAPFGTDGIRAAWQAEGLALAQNKPKIREVLLRMHKLIAFVPMTDELMQDAPALNAYLPRRCGDSIRAKTNEAILFGTGAGQPLGAFTGAGVTGSCAVTVPKEAAQATQTLVIQNLARMAQRLPQGSWNRAVWLINNDSLLGLLTLGAVTYPMGPPPANFPSACGSLLGLPVIVSQHAKAFSTQGDVLLLDMSYYLALTKAVQIQTMLSLHVYFDSYNAAFRATFRIDGQPKIVSSITPLNGVNQLSPFIQLGAR